MSSSLDRTFNCSRYPRSASSVTNVPPLNVNWVLLDLLFTKQGHDDVAIYIIYIIYVYVCVCVCAEKRTEMERHFILMNPSGGQKPKAISLNAFNL